MGVYTLYQIHWGQLENGKGKHLTFGVYPEKAPDPWITVDLNEPEADERVDLLKNNWPWSSVAAIHCVGMVYQWPVSEHDAFFKRCKKALRKDGVLWFGDTTRHFRVQPVQEYLHQLGFFVQEASTMAVMGREKQGNGYQRFAFKGTKE